jgi:hypothetical protein
MLLSVIMVILWPTFAGVALGNAKGKLTINVIVAPNTVSWRLELGTGESRLVVESNVERSTSRPTRAGDIVDDTRVLGGEILGYGQRSVRRRMNQYGRQKLFRGRERPVN